MRPALSAGRSLSKTSITAGAVLLGVALGGTAGVDHTLSAAVTAPASVVGTAAKSPTFVDDHGGADGGHGGHGGHDHGHGEV
jgi:hypothetical protein